MNIRLLRPLIAFFALCVYGRMIWQSSTVINGERFFSLFDDAMISMTYARNLAQGEGLRWNPGDFPVEGYTNLLWTLMMSLIHVTGIPEAKICAAVMFLGVVIMFVTGWAAARLADFSAGPTAAIIAYVGVLLSFSLAFWTIRGMEVGLIACLSISAYMLVYTRAVSSDSLTVRIMLAALLLTRMDSALVVGALIILGSFLATSRTQQIRSVIKNVVWCTAVIGAHTLFRLWYYNEPLPNTYTLKVSGFPLSMRIHSGLGYLIASWQSWVPWVVFAGIGVLNTSRKAQAACLACVGVLGLQIVYSVYVGGDAWESSGFLNRYISQAVPFLAVSVGVSCATIIDRGRSLAKSPAIGGFTALLAFLGVFICTEGRNYRTWMQSGLYLAGQDMITVRIAVEIREATSPDARVAVVMAGAIPYFSRRYSIDLLGKSDPFIARDEPHWPGWFYPGHMKWNYRHSIESYRPDVIHQLWLASEQDKQLVISLGYDLLANSMYVRKGSSAVNREKLGAI